VGVAAGFIASYATSVHGMALAAGNQKSAVCSDCHGSHDLKKASDPSSRVNKRNIAETCARCHFDISKTYDESIHGIAVKKGRTDAPTCTNCHGEHQIYAHNDPRSPVAPLNVSERVCGLCHNSLPLNQKYGMPSQQFDSFSDSYHGLAAKAGSVEVANCASCHGVHNIKPSSDPTSTVNRANLAATCGRCHPGANRNFARGNVHVLMARTSGSRILYWIRIVYISLIVIVVGGMFLHNFFDFLRKTGHRLAVRQGKIAPLHYGAGQYIRMTLNERIQHAVVFSSFILLVLTGFMLRFPDAWWVVPIRQMSGKFFAVRSITHRIAGVLMIAVSLYHLCHLFFTRRGKQFGRDMLPRWRDIGDAWLNVRYLVGLSKKKPLFDRFGYIEKAEYWALTWGVVIMAATGIVMWFDNYFIGLFTKLGWDISRTIHFYEACLATWAIVVWHFYFVIFNPDVYPMSTAWLTGKISEEEMAQEHPLELARIKSAPSENEPSPVSGE
jgi:cytochrome b subunit of formate dehydrogenase